MTSATRSTFGRLGLVALAIIFVVAVSLANVILRGARLDLTQNKLYTLSPGTMKVLGNISEPINLYFFFSEKATADVPYLHFEACYYQAIDYAIVHGIARVEAGAQGEHKIQRGYLPVETASAHWIADAGFRKAVADFLKRERAGVRRELAALAELSPYRCEDRPGAA